MNTIASGVRELLESVSRIAGLLVAGADVRLGQLRVALREELRHVAAMLVLSILAGACAFAALVFGAMAILIASWSTHPALAASLIAAGFALVCLLAVLWMLGNSR